MADAPATTPAATTPAATTPAATAPAATVEVPNVPRHDWTKQGLDPDTLGYVQNKGWTDQKAAIDSYRNLEKLAGGGLQDLIRVPKTADQKEWDAVYTKLGRPEKVEGYQLPAPAGDKGDFAKQVAPWFHKVGLSQSQAASITTDILAYADANSKAAQDKANQVTAEQVTALQTEWGADYSVRAGLVDKAASSFGMTPEQLQGLKLVLGADGAMKFMYNIGSKIAIEEGTFITGETRPGFGGMSKEAAASRINELRQDRAFIQQFNSQDPKVRMESRAEMDRLHKIAFPETQTV